MWSARSAVPPRPCRGGDPRGRTTLNLDERRKTLTGSEGEETRRRTPSHMASR
jgi:hypothetical protein